MQKNGDYVRFGISRAPIDEDRSLLNSSVFAQNLVNSSPATIW